MEEEEKEEAEEELEWEEKEEVEVGGSRKRWQMKGTGEDTGSEHRVGDAAVRAWVQPSKDRHLMWC